MSDCAPVLHRVKRQWVPHSTVTKCDKKCHDEFGSLQISMGV